MFLVGLSGYYGAMVLPKHLYEGTDVRKNPYNLKPVGTGPFKVVEYQPRRQLVVERFDGYWGPKARAERITFRFMPEPEIRLEALRRVIEGARRFLLPGGLLAMEIGETQGNAVRELLQAAGSENARVEKDLERRDRLAFGTQPAANGPQA